MGAPTMTTSAQRLPPPPPSPGRGGSKNTGQFIQKILPFFVFGLAVLVWELTVRINNIPHYILPAPTLVLKTLWDNLGSLMVSWLYTMKITFGALLLAVVGGVALAMLFALNKCWSCVCSRLPSCCRSRPSWRLRR